jgi:hypothetical protein
VSQKLPKWLAREMSAYPPIATAERTWRDVSKVPLGYIQAWRELKEATDEVAIMFARQNSPPSLILVGSRTDDLKSKVPGNIASEIGGSSGEKVPIKVAEAYAFT